MNITLPPFDLNNLHFEKNHRIFANCIASGFSKYVLEELRKDYESLDYVAPHVSDKEEWSLNMDITKKVGMAAVQYFTQPCIYLQPFSSWMERLTSASNLNDNPAEYYQERMKRVGVLAEAKLKELLSVYASHPMRSTFRYDVELDRANIELRVKFWIDPHAQQAKL